MPNEMMNHFDLVKPFREVGYFETEHHKSIAQQTIEAIRLGKIVAISGIVGSGKTTLLRNLEQKLKQNKILVSRSLSVEKDRVTLTMLIIAMFYDLSKEKDIKIPSQPEKRIRELRELIRKRKMPVVLIIDEAHDLHSKTLVGLKRLMESIQDCGGSLSIILAGHNKLQNDLKRPSFEEIGTRAILLNLDGIIATKREYIMWLIKNCIAKDSKPESIITEEAVDLLADRLVTPLQIQHYITLAFEEAFKIGIKPISPDVIDSIIAKDIDDLEPRLTRYGYNVKTLASVLNIRLNVVKSFLRGQLPPGQTQEIQNEILAMGVPV